MEAKDAFELGLTWCRKHRNWWITICPDCMVDSNEENIKQAGRKEVVEYLKPFTVEASMAGKQLSQFIIYLERPDWRAKLKEWGIDEATNR